MTSPSSNLTTTTLHHERQHHTYSFRKNNDQWFINYQAETNEQSSKTNTRRLKGANDLLSLMSWGRNLVNLTLGTQPFEDAVVLDLVQLCDEKKGGGYYFIRNYRGIEVNKLLWIEDLSLLLFGDIPERIYIRKETMQ